MASPDQRYQKLIHDTLHSESLPSEIKLGKYLDDDVQNIVEQPGWRTLSSDQFWLLVQKLATCNNVTRFEFSGNKVGPQAFAALAQVLGFQKCLTHIDLRECDVRDIGCKNLAVVLETHCVVQFLGLSRNRIRRTGSKLLSRALKKCTTLQHIDMSHNDIGPRGCMCIQQPLRVQANLRHVDLSDCGFDDDSFFWTCDALANCSSLRYLALSDNGIGPKEAEMFAKALKRQTSLQFLNLAGNKFGPTACIKLSTSLKGGTSLLHVNIRGNMILDKGLAALSESLCTHVQLRFLNVGGNSLTGIGGQLLMLTLPHLPLLSHLDMSCNGIDRKAAGGIAETLALTAPNLESVNLSNNKMGGEGLFHISQSLGTRSQLKHIDLRGNDANFSGCFNVVDNVRMLANLKALLIDEEGELMSKCVDSAAYVAKFPPPPPELLARKQWVELLRFIQNPNAPWKTISENKILAASPDDDAAFDSDVHCDDDADVSDSSAGGSSCEIESHDQDSSSSDDDAEDEWEDAGPDDGTSDSGKDANDGDVVGSKRPLAQAKPQKSANISAVGAVASVTPAAKKKGASFPSSAALAAVANAIIVAGAAAPGVDSSVSAVAKPPKQPYKSAIADVVGKGELAQHSVEYLRQLCQDSGLSSAGNKPSIIKRLQARYLV
jgi:Ran GTPase-activating protein (RanGAP) involved in mRNA processing and transport